VVALLELARRGGLGLGHGGVHSTTSGGREALPLGTHSSRSDGCLD
jgi:hypothetical protein